ncbi:hypothetical protein KIPB_006410, partial [Kipferlia bialata]
WRKQRLIQGATVNRDVQTSVSVTETGTGEDAEEAESRRIATERDVAVQVPVMMGGGGEGPAETVGEGEAPVQTPAARGRERDFLRRWLRPIEGILVDNTERERVGERIDKERVVDAVTSKYPKHGSILCMYDLRTCLAVLCAYPKRGSTKLLFLRKEEMAGGEGDAYSSPIFAPTVYKVLGECQSVSPILCCAPVRNTHRDTLVAAGTRDGLLCVYALPPPTSISPTVAFSVGPDPTYSPVAMACEHVRPITSMCASGDTQYRYQGQGQGEGGPELGLSTSLSLSSVVASDGEGLTLWTVTGKEVLSRVPLSPPPPRDDPLCVPLLYEAVCYLDPNSLLLYREDRVLAVVSLSAAESSPAPLSLSSQGIASKCALVSLPPHTPEVSGEHTPVPVPRVALCHTGGLVIVSLTPSAEESGTPSLSVLYTGSALSAPLADREREWVNDQIETLAVYQTLCVSPAFDTFV